MIIHDDIIQGSWEWLQLRLGLATASRFKDILATTRSGPSASRATYKAELLTERITKRPVERYTSSAMRWGLDFEEVAKQQYWIETGDLPRTVGFVQHDLLQLGASPDGLIGERGGIEIKCPGVAVHLATIKAQAMPPEHLPQIQGNLWITERKWWDFVSFVPELRGDAQMFVQRIYRDEEYINTLAVKVEEFLEELEEDIKFIESYQGAKAG